MVNNRNQRAQEGVDQINSIRRPMESEQQASLRILETVSQDREIVRQQTQKFRAISQRSELAALFPRAEVQTLTHQVHEARETSECFLNLNVRTLAERHRIVAQRNRAQNRRTSASSEI